MAGASQLGLLKNKRFAGLFWTQFLGAFNDNLFKNALLVLFTFLHIQDLPQALSSNSLANLAAALFIVPFFIFSPIAGQLADKYAKSKLMRYCKWAEFIVVCFGVWALYAHHFPALLGVLFLLGTQATFLGPLKYGLLPEILQARELIAGNALIEGATFIAILMGTLAGSVLMSLDHGVYNTAGLLLIIAMLGIVTAHLIPTTQAGNSQAKLDFNWFHQTIQILKLAHRNHAVFNSIVGISWFWLLGTVILTQMPDYARSVLHTEALSLPFINAAFALGIGCGSLMCEYLSNQRIELGLVPLGSIGLTLFTIDFAFIHPIITTHPLPWRAFLQTGTAWHVLFDLFCIGLSGGLYTVPLYALIQQRTPKSLRARIIAANNIINSLFMVIGAISCTLWLARGRTISQLFWLIGLMNGLVAWYIYRLVPEFVMRFLVWLLVNTVYRVEADLSHVPKHGAAILVANHVSFMDPLLVLGTSPRPIRFVMDHSIFKWPIMHFIFKEARAIPIASQKENPIIKAQAFETIAAALADGELIGFFPEGGITHDGELMPFKKGIEQIIARSPVPVIPVAVRGIWGSFFSRRYGKAMSHWPKRWWGYPVELRSGPIVVPHEVSAEHLQAIIQALRGDIR